MTPAEAPHVPVLIDPLIAAVSPVNGVWLDGTFGAGGYSLRLLEAGAHRVIGLDRDPDAVANAPAAVGLEVRQATFSTLAEQPEAPFDGIVLDLGVSSMQIDQADRGFSFQKDGPLDMRMAQEGPSAADFVNSASEQEIADVIFHYGEDRASRRIARAIIKGRPFARTIELADAVSSVLPRQKPGQSHPATRTFQALRIAVNGEFRELLEGLAAAETALKPGGWLAVVTFHSLEDRVVKRFLQARAGQARGVSRYAPAADVPPAQLELKPRKAIGPTEAEIEANPRARSAKLRVAQRTEAPITPIDRSALGLPGPKHWWET